MNLLVVSTICCILEYVIPVFVKYFTSRLYARTKYDNDLWNDLTNLKQEMAGISMVDEFAKYAKLQRKYTKLEGALKNNVNNRLAMKMKIQFAVTYGFRLINGLLILVLLYLYNNEPVIILPKGMLWPIQNFLSWPSYHEDSISLMMWLVIARLVIYTCKKVDVSHCTN